MESKKGKNIHREQDIMVKISIRKEENRLKVSDTKML
jgi:hypothetical protein